jgi:hypothetical protein
MNIRLLSMMPPPPSIPLLPDILFCDHDHGPRLMHLAEKDTDAREVIVQFAEGDLSSDADAKERSFLRLAQSRCTVKCTL